MIVTYFEYEGGIKDPTPRTMIVRGDPYPPDPSCSYCDEPIDDPDDVLCDECRAEEQTKPTNEGGSP